MAGVKGLRSEVILVCAVDYFTGAVLLNRVVDPGEKVRDWRTKIHGITEAAMKAAVSSGQALAGWAGARAELWKLIDQDTILIGHALQHDLDVLRMVHTRIVDSAILARNAVSTFKNQWGLQRLCEELLGTKIRDNRGAVHDCFEDVLATRALVLYCVQNNAKLEAWAEAKRLQLTRERELKKAAREKLARQRAEAAKPETKLSIGLQYSSDDEEEMLHWSDIAEDLGWPHPDTGYDPWSD
jgi:DNA polymerase III epsilon subunit-like protein